MIRVHHWCAVNHSKRLILWGIGALVEDRDQIQECIRSHFAVPAIIRSVDGATDSFLLIAVQKQCVNTGPMLNEFVGTHGYRVERC